MTVVLVVVAAEADNGDCAAGVAAYFFAVFLIIKFRR